MQVQMGTTLAYKLGFKEGNVTLIEDHGVSSLKVSAQERPGLIELKKLVENNRINTVIVYDRDRIARNMIEYLSFLDTLAKHRVNMVFSNPLAEPLSNKLSREAQLALDAENEGKKIVARTIQASKYYPHSLYGYNKLGTKGTTRYEMNEDEIKVVNNIFSEFSTISTIEQFQSMNKRYKEAGINILKIVANPYYSAHLIHEDYSEPLTHIEGVTDVNTIRANMSKLANWGLLDRLPQAMPTYFITSSNLKLCCSLCSKPIDLQLKGNQKFLKCSNHPRVKIEVSRLEEIIKEHIVSTINLIDRTALKANMDAKLHQLHESLREEITVLKTNLYQLEQLFKEVKMNELKVKSLLQNISEAESKIDEVRHTINGLSSLKLNVNQLHKIIENNYYNYIESDLIMLINTFTDQVKLLPEHVQIFTRFSKYLKGVS